MGDDPFADLIPGGGAADDPFADLVPKPKARPQPRYAEDLTAGLDQPVRRFGRVEPAAPITEPLPPPPASPTIGERVKRVARAAPLAVAETVGEELKHPLALPKQALASMIDYAPFAAVIPAQGAAFLESAGSEALFPSSDRPITERIRQHMEANPVNRAGNAVLEAARSVGDRVFGAPQTPAEKVTRFAAGMVADPVALYQAVKAGKVAPEIARALHPDVPAAPGTADEAAGLARPDMMAPEPSRPPEAPQRAPEPVQAPVAEAPPSAPAPVDPFADLIPPARQLTAGAPEMSKVEAPAVEPPPPETPAEGAPEAGHPFTEKPALADRGPSRFGKFSDQALLDYYGKLHGRMALANETMGEVMPWSRNVDSYSGNVSGTKFTNAAGRAVGATQRDARLVDELTPELTRRGLTPDDLAIAAHQAIGSPETVADLAPPPILAGAPSMDAAPGLAEGVPEPTFSEVGGVKPATLAGAAGALAGGAAGATQGDTPAEHITNAALGAVGGAVAGYGGVKALEGLMERVRRAPPDVYAHEPIGSEALKIPAESQLPEAPGLEARRRGKSTFGQSLKAVFNPTSLSERAGATGGTIRAEAAKGARMVAIAKADLHQASTLVGQLNKRQSIALWDAAERWGQPGTRETAAQLHADFPALIDAFHARSQTFTKELTDLGILRATIDEYVGRFWEKGSGGPGMARAKRPLEGPKSFAKQRVYEHFADGIAAGEVPSTYNFVDAQLAKFEEMGKAIAGRRMVNAELEASKASDVPRGKWVMVGEEPPGEPDGRKWQRVSEADPAFTLYKDPNIPIAEGYDAAVREGLQKVIADLKIVHQRTPRLGQRWGEASPAPLEEMRTKFAGPEKVIEHELGHILDWRYGLWDKIVEPAPREARTLTRGKNVGQTFTRAAKQEASVVQQRKVIQTELRALADLRAGEAPDAIQNVGPGRRAYLRNKEEKIANMVNALIHAPERMAQVAPTVKAKLTAFFQARPELAPLLDIKPSVRLGEGGATVHAGGIVTAGHYYAPPDVAAVWKNYLSPGIAGSPIYRAVAAPGRAVVQTMLGLSGFHATTIATESAFSEMGRALEHASTGEGRAALGALGRAPAVAVQGAREGSRIAAEYLHPGTHPELAPVLNAMIEGGFRLQAKSELWEGDRAKAFTQALREALHAEDLGSRAWGAAKAGPNAILAAIEAGAYPVLGKYVPLQKANATYMKAADVLKTLPPDASPDVLRKAMWDLNKEMDFRFGQVIYDNHFINNTAKHLAQLLLLAPGWTFGTLALVGRGAKDVARIGADLAHLRKPALGPSAAYWMGAFGGTAIINGILTAAHTGEMPSGKDFLAWRDGTTDDEGNPNRHTLPGYIMKDLFGWSHHPVRTATAKLSPGLHWAYSVLANRNYWGDMVYNPQDSWPEIVKQLGSSALEQTTPLSYRNWVESERRGEAPGRAVLRNVFGVTPAPREFQRTAAQNLMHEDLSRRGSGSATPEEAADRRARSRLLSDLRSGRANEDEIQALAPGERARLFARARTPVDVEAFKRLTASEAADVYDQADPEAQRMLIHTLRSKLANAKRVGRALAGR